ncbi:MAG: type IV secretory system conjugative DNA transfer family protein, partial [Patescibacteria group bacterium]
TKSFFSKKQVGEFPIGIKPFTFWCFGTTRAGKSMMTLNMAKQNIENGDSVVFLDSKCESGILSEIKKAAEKAGRIADVKVINADTDYNSINLFSIEFTSEEIIEHIMSVVNGWREPFFNNFCREILQAYFSVKQFLSDGKHVFSSLKIIADMKYQDMITIKEELENMITKLKDIANLSEKDSEKKFYRDKIIDVENVLTDFKKTIDAPKDYLIMSLSHIRVALTQMNELGFGTNSQQKNELFELIHSDKTFILVVQAGGLAQRDKSGIVLKSILSVVRTSAARDYSSAKNIKKRMHIYLDEAQNLLYRGVDDLFALSPMIGYYIYGFCQSINQMKDTAGEELTKSILDNTYTKVFMRTSDIATAEYAGNELSQCLENLANPKIYHSLESGEFFVKTIKNKKEYIYHGKCSIVELS